MSNVVRMYTDEIYQQFKYWANWLPTGRLRLGDVGPVKKRVFDPQFNLEDLGVELDPNDDAQPTHLQYKSSGGVDTRFQTKVGNQVIPQIPQGTAGIEISFSSSGGVVFALQEGRASRLGDLSVLERKVLPLIERGDVPREYAVVTHVMHAAALTVIISRSGSAKFVASAEADLLAGLLDLAKLEANLSVVSASNVETEIIAASGATPLLKLSGFKRDGWFWGSPRISPLGFDSDPDPGFMDELVLEETDEVPE